MKEFVTIVYANRNRDLKRIKASFDSLKCQTDFNFRVIFVDYGSEEISVDNLKQLCNCYIFVTPFFLPVSQLLWNKSKALNYGISQTQSPYIFIADVDLIFHPETVALFNKLAVKDKFFLFNLGYLDRAESEKLNKSYNFEDLNPSRFGMVNGMILSPTKAFLGVNGLDEFFHFYGSEDEDLFARMENAGYKREANTAAYFYHSWHQSFAGSEDEIITGNPRVKNIMRINQRHFQFNHEKGIIQPLRQQRMGSYISPERATALQNPNIKLEIPNILARVEHFLREELPSRRGEVVQAEFYEDEYYNTLKYKLKSIIGKQTQPYISLKEVNDIILKEILYNYRDHNYSYSLGKELKRIKFCIEV